MREEVEASGTLREYLQYVYKFGEANLGNGLAKVVAGTCVPPEDFKFDMDHLNERKAKGMLSGNKRSV